MAAFFRSVTRRDYKPGPHRAHRGRKCASEGKQHRYSATAGRSQEVIYNREPTSGLEPLTCSLRVIHQALQVVAQPCETRISGGVSFLRIAARCTVLHS